VCCYAMWLLGHCQVIKAQPVKFSDHLISLSMKWDFLSTCTGETRKIRILRES